MNTTTQRVFGLDLIRMLAIFLVLFSHSSHMLMGIVPESLNYWFGFMGVELFFILSGFLIGRIIIKDVSSDNYSFNRLVRFWKLRWYRTIPIYFIALIFFSVILFIYKDYYFVYYNPKWYLYFAFLQNSWTIEPELFGIAWSLSVEEWFYIITPLAFFLLYKKQKMSKEIQFKVILSLIVMFLGARILFLIIEEPSNFDLAIRKRMPFRLDSLIYGVLVAFLFIHFKDKLFKNRIILLMFGLLINGIVMFIIIDDFQPTLNHLSFLELAFLFPLLSTAISCIIPFFYKLKANTIIKAMVTFFSVISYSIYLFHIPLIIIVKNTLETGKFSFLTVWFVTILFSSLTYKLIEKPILHLRNLKLKHQ